MTGNTLIIILVKSYDTTRIIVVFVRLRIPFSFEVKSATLLMSQKGKLTADGVLKIMGTKAYESE